MESGNEIGEFTVADSVEKVSEVPVKDRPESLEYPAAFVGQIDLDKSRVTGARSANDKAFSLHANDSPAHGRLISYRECCQFADRPSILV